MALEWGIHGMMDELAQIKDESAIATVHGARWLFQWGTKTISNQGTRIE